MLIKIDFDIWEFQILNACAYVYICILSVMHVSMCCKLKFTRELVLDHKKKETHADKGDC
jgi:hypothetical protein